MEYTTRAQIAKGNMVLNRLNKRLGPKTAALTAVAVLELHNVQA
jgi:hypothetical protein